MFQDGKPVLTEREEKMVQAAVRSILRAAAKEPWDVHHQVKLDESVEPHEAGLLEIEQLQEDVVAEMNEGRYERAWVMAEAYRRIVAAAPRALAWRAVELAELQEENEALLKVVRATGVVGCPPGVCQPHNCEAIYGALAALPPEVKKKVEE